MYLPGLRGFHLQQGWLFHILSKCIYPLPLAGGFWYIYWSGVGVFTDKDCIFCTWEDYMTWRAHVFLCLCPFAHTVYVWAKAAAVLQQEWLQGAHPRSVPRTGIGVTQSFYSFFFCTLLFLNFLHLVCKAASPAQHHAGELWAGIPCTAGCQPHGQADRKSQRAVQPAPTPTDIQTAQASSSLCSQPASAAFYFTRKCHALTQSWMLWG